MTTLFELLAWHEVDGLLAMSLNIESLVQREARLFVNMTYQILLCLGAWLGQHWAASILIRADRSDDCSDHVTILDSGSYRLEHKRDDALSSCVAVRTVIEAVTQTIGRQKLLV